MTIIRLFNHKNQYWQPNNLALRQWCLPLTAFCFSTPREQFPVKVLMHSSQTTVYGGADEQLHSEKLAKRGQLNMIAKGVYKRDKESRAVENKAEQKQHYQNTVITLVWSVIQVKILMWRLTVKTKGKTTRARRPQTPHDGNVLAISTVSRFTVTTKAARTSL